MTGPPPPETPPIHQPAPRRTFPDLSNFDPSSHSPSAHTHQQPNQRTSYNYGPTNPQGYSSSANPNYNPQGQPQMHQNPQMGGHVPQGQPNAGYQPNPQYMAGGGGGGGGIPPYQMPTFLQDSTLQMGRTAFAAVGQQYIDRAWLPPLNVSALKHLLNVTNQYVVRKIGILLFPWKHRPWSRHVKMNPTAEAIARAGHLHAPQAAEDGGYYPPRDDINAPDLYIPLMAIVTYVLLSAWIAGMNGNFHPTVLGSVASTAVLVVVLELCSLKLACFLLSIQNDSQLLDLFAYSGYKFVGVIVSTGINALLTGGRTDKRWSWIGWAAFVYTYQANAFFVLRSLRYVIFPDASTQPENTSVGFNVVRAQRYRRTQLLFAYAYVVQLVFMWMLS